MSEAKRVSVAIEGFRLVSERGTSGFAVGREILECVASDRSVDCVYLLAPRRLAEADYPIPANVHVVTPRHNHFPEYSFRRQIYWMQIAIPKLLRRLNPMPDVLVMPYHHTPLLVPRSCRVCTIVHDICGLDPAFYSRFKLGYYRHWIMLRTAMHSATDLVPISHFTARAFQERFPRARRKLREVLWNSVGCPMLRKADVEETVGKLSLDVGEYLLAFGSADKRKGFDRVLEAYGTYKRLGGRKRLVVLAQPDCDVAGGGLQYGLDPASLTVLPKLADGERDALYGGASAFLFFSRGEGFGLPVVEAMRQGCPPLFVAGGPADEIVPPTDAWLGISPWSPEGGAKRMLALDGLSSGDRFLLAGRLRARSTLFDRESYRTKLRQLLG